MAGGESDADDRPVQEGERTRLCPDRRPTKAGRRVGQTRISAFERAAGGPRDVALEALKSVVGTGERPTGVVRSVADVSAGAELITQVADGTITSTIASDE